jgi:lambda family phage holin
LNDVTINSNVIIVFICPLRLLVFLNVLTTTSYTKVPVPMDNSQQRPRGFTVLDELVYYANNLPPNAWGGIMAAAVAVLRILYDGKERSIVQKIADPLICGLIGYSSLPVIRATGLDGDIALFVGCVIGGLGVDQLRSLTTKLLDSKIKKQ